MKKSYFKPFKLIKMRCAKTQKGGYLVQVNTVYGCYTDREGTFLRSVEDVTEEFAWAEETWSNYEEIEFPTEFEQPLLKSLEYLTEYRQSLVVG